MDVVKIDECTRQLRVRCPRLRGTPLATISEAAVVLAGRACSRAAWDVCRPPKYEGSKRTRSSSDSSSRSNTPTHK